VEVEEEVRLVVTVDVVVAGIQKPANFSQARGFTSRPKPTPTPLISILGQRKSQNTQLRTLHATTPRSRHIHCTHSLSAAMAESYDDPDLEHYNLSDSDDHLFDTPAHKQAKSKAAGMPANGKPTEQAQQAKPRAEESRYDTEEAEKQRDIALRQELENVRKINEVIEGVVESLEKAKSNMGVSIVPTDAMLAD
jgi:hypothetical protein